MSKKIVILGGDIEATHFLYNGIKDYCVITKVVLEQKIDKGKFLKRRMKRLGLKTVLGQILFQVSIPKLLRLTSRERIRKITEQYELDGSSIPSEMVLRVSSVNAQECIDYLKKEEPDLIIVNGTRIISTKVLSAVDATFVNTHAGITPRYRGVHGGYWAMTNDDQENCGVTVHLVDKGIDTGGVLRQELIKPTSEDNFYSYPYLQTGEGIALMKEVIADFSADTLETMTVSKKESQLYYHPTLWFYLWNRIRKGVK